MTVWAIGFTHGDRRWYSRLLKKGFGHCLCMKEVDGRTCMVNHRGKMLSIDFMDNDLSEVTAFMSENGWKVLFLGVEDVSEQCVRPIMSCVSVVEACLGISKHCLTPFRLYNALIRRGATELR